MDCIDRFKRMNSINGTTDKEYYINVGKDTFEKYVSTIPNSVDFKINDETVTYTGALQSQSKDGVKGDGKLLLVSLDSQLKVGDYVCLQNSSDISNRIWLVTGLESEVLHTHRKFLIKETNYIVKIMLSNDNIIEIPIIKEYKTSYGVEADKVIEWGAGKISFQIKDTDDTRLIVRGTRLFIDEQLWVVKNIEKHDGILAFMCLEDTVNQNNDDIVNEIADRFKYQTPYVYTITIDPNSNASIYPLDTFQSNVKAYKNNVLMVNPIIEYSSSNNTIATISDTGLVTGINLGNCIISATFKDEFNKPYTISFDLIIEVKPKAYTITVDPMIISLNEGQTQQLTTVVREDGIIINSILAYSSSDNTIATVSSTGLITAILEGNAIITASYTDNLNVVHTATINTIVTEPLIVDNFTFDWTYGGTVTFAIKKYQTGTYYPHKYNHGIELSTLWDFTVSNYIAPASSSTVTVSTITDTSLKIKQTSNNLTSGSLTIIATERNNPLNTYSQVITFIT